MRSYRDLLVWQKSMLLVTQIYRITKMLPQEELYGLSNQMRRCSVSIPSNIAEGYGRNFTNDYIRFLQIARGSLYELKDHLISSYDIGYINEDLLEEGLNIIESAKMILNGFINYLDNKIKK